jgi:hypothetical protein
VQPIAKFWSWVGRSSRLLTFAWVSRDVADYLHG